MRRRIISFILVLGAVLTALTALNTVRASAAPLTNRGASVLAEAQTRAGDWYVYGADGPTAFDCSGLVYWAAHRLGINMPRDTYSMLSTGISEGILIPTWHPVAGDLAFYGAGHVEIVAHGHNVTFGAQQPGTPVGFHTWNGYWHPTAYFEIR